MSKNPFMMTDQCAALAQDAWPRGVHTVYNNVSGPRHSMQQAPGLHTWQECAELCSEVRCKSFLHGPLPSVNWNLQLGRCRNTDASLLAPQAPMVTAVQTPEQCAQLLLKAQAIVPSTVVAEYFEATVTGICQIAGYGAMSTAGASL